MVKEVSFGCQIISSDFTILLDYLVIFKVNGLTEVNGHVTLHHRLLSHRESKCNVNRIIKYNAFPLFSPSNWL